MSTFIGLGTGEYRPLHGDVRCRISGYHSPDSPHRESQLALIILVKAKPKTGRELWDMCCFLKMSCNCPSMHPRIVVGFACRQSKSNRPSLILQMLCGIHPLWTLRAIVSSAPGAANHASTSWGHRSVISRARRPRGRWNTRGLPADHQKYWGGGLVQGPVG